VAVHSDTWLLAVAFYNGARLNREGRERLFELINEFPTCYEIVSGKVAANVARPKKRGAPGQPSRPTALPPPAKISRPVIFLAPTVSQCKGIAVAALSWGMLSS
jgi:hypothetical protein